MNKYIQTARMSALSRTGGGLLSLLPEVLIRVFTLVPQIFLWRTVMASGADVGMSASQMLSYTAASALFAELLLIQSEASGWLAEGVLLRLFGRPLPVLSQLAAQTLGRCLPMLILFSLPMAALAVLFGVRLIPASAWFLPSLLLCISLGFAVDFLFACLAIRLRSMTWLISRLRMAVAAVFSGTVIPIRLLPFGLDAVLKYQPFASLGGAPLSIFAGIADLRETLMLQILWNLILWPIALYACGRSREGMVSYGG